MSATGGKGLGSSMRARRNPSGAHSIALSETTLLKYKESQVQTSLRSQGMVTVAGGKHKLREDGGSLLR